MNSEPLSYRLCVGIPRLTNSSARINRTSCEQIRLATTEARHSRMYSSRIFRIRKSLPSYVRSATKLYDQTWLSCSSRLRCRSGWPSRDGPAWVASAALEDIPGAKSCTPDLPHVPALASQLIRHCAVAVPPVLLDERDDANAPDSGLTVAGNDSWTGPGQSPDRPGTRETWSSVIACPPLLDGRRSFPRPLTSRCHCPSRDRPRAA